MEAFANLVSLYFTEGMTTTTGDEALRKNIRQFGILPGYEEMIGKG